jgi:hypothetical protein
MYWTIKTSSSILTGCPEAPTNRFESWAARNLVRFQIVAANLDPEVLQWPGGSLIASLLWLCMMARSLWSVGTVARLHLRGAPAGSPRIARPLMDRNDIDKGYSHLLCPSLLNLQAKPAGAHRVDLTIGQRRRIGADTSRRTEHQIRCVCRVHGNKARSQKDMSELVPEGPW